MYHALLRISCHIGHYRATPRNQARGARSERAGREGRWCLVDWIVGAALAAVVAAYIVRDFNRRS